MIICLAASRPVSGRRDTVRLFAVSVKGGITNETEQPRFRISKSESDLLAIGGRLSDALTTIQDQSDPVYTWPVLLRVITNGLGIYE